MAVKNLSLKYLIKNISTQQKYLILIISFAALMWNLPIASIPVKAWHMFVIFITTIAGILLNVLPMGCLSLIALSVATISNTLSIEQSLASFSSPIIWLVFSAFLLARGFVKTGLGSRIAFYFVGFLGHSTLGLGYGFLITELLLAPFIPSNTARGAGIIYPIASSLSVEYGSCPSKGTQADIGKFLLSLCFHSNIVTSTIFLTAMATNPFMISIAESLKFPIKWITWFKAACLPGGITLILLPLVIYAICPPTIKRNDNAKEFSAKKLAEMGPMKWQEIIMIITFIILLVLWICGDKLAINATSSALIGLSILLVTGVLNWQDVLQEKNAWNTFIWMGALLNITNQLTSMGFMQILSQSISPYLQNLGWQWALAILIAIYFYSQYIFASLTAHVSALFSALAFIALSCNAPIGLTMWSFIFSSILCASLTHYSTGSAPVYYSSGYFTMNEWWKIGGILSIMYFLIWGGIGPIWWKFLDLY